MLKSLCLHSTVAETAKHLVTVTSLMKNKQSSETGRGNIHQSLPTISDTNLVDLI